METWANFPMNPLNLATFGLARISYEAQQECQWASRSCGRNLIRPGINRESVHLATELAKCETPSSIATTVWFGGVGSSHQVELQGDTESQAAEDRHTDKENPSRSLPSHFGNDEGQKDQEQKCFADKYERQAILHSCSIGLCGDQCIVEERAVDHQKAKNCGGEKERADFFELFHFCFQIQRTVNMAAGIIGVQEPGQEDQRLK